METYSLFLNRINSFEKNKIDLRGFEVNPSLVHKVEKDNSFKNFYGDTVVFKLNETVKNKLNEYVDIIYGAAPECFCERLDPNTFHITLHDLSNSPVLDYVTADMSDNKLKVIKLKNEIQKYGTGGIKMNSRFIFNMVNTSLVLGLYPADENEYGRLMKLYNILDGVKKLPYPFTPHITLAYYNINGFDKNSARALENAVNSINREINLSITTTAVYYQKFASMNDYTDIVALFKDE